VSETEVQRRLEVLDLLEGSPDGGPVDPRFPDLLRRSILVDRYLSQEVVGDVTVSEEEVAAGTHSAAATAEGPLVVYRQAMTSSLEEAREIVRRVNMDLEPFPEVAAELSLSPDGAQPQISLLGQLPPEVGDILAGGPRGGVVGPVAVDCGLEEAPGACRYYVFLIENREDLGPTAAGTPEEIRESLRRDKQAEQLERYLETLQQSGRIVLHADSVPFPYVDRELAAEDAP